MSIWVFIQRRKKFVISVVKKMENYFTFVVATFEVSLLSGFAASNREILSLLLDGRYFRGKGGGGRVTIFGTLRYLDLYCVI